MPKKKIYNKAALYENIKKRIIKKLPVVWEKNKFENKKRFLALL